MKTFLRILFNILFGSEKTTDLALENLALRQQLAILKQSKKRPQIPNRDRLFWILLSRFWNGWRETLTIVKPHTVVQWHRKGFKLFWRLKSRRKGPGRPPISAEIYDLVRRLARINPLWGSSQNSRRTAQTGDQDFRAHGFQPDALSWHQAAIPNLANIPEKPHDEHGFDRFFHRSHRYLPDSARTGSPQS